MLHAEVMGGQGLAWIEARDRKMFAPLQRHRLDPAGRCVRLRESIAEHGLLANDQWGPGGERRCTIEVCFLALLEGFDGLM